MLGWYQYLSMVSAGGGQVLFDQRIAQQSDHP